MTMNKRILIITNSRDLHADIVVSNLIAKGSNPFRINLNEFPVNFKLNMEFFHREWVGLLTHIPSNDSLSINEIGAVWLRKKADFGYISDDLSQQEKAFATGETEHTLFSLLFSLNCFWMSHPTAIRGALWKGEQLLRATKFGFSVPATLIANHAAPVKQFKNKIDGEMIFKAMSSSQLAGEMVDDKHRITGGLPTTIITDKHMEYLDAVNELPCCFQAYIPKEYELRVTVIGDKIFAAKIHSQDDERTKTDFRDFSAEINYEATELPCEIKRRCLDFVHSYQLNFSALDIIVTTDGDYVFLENNPVGQYLFVEQLIPQLKMMDATTDCLIEGAAC